MSTPTSRTLDRLRGDGWTADVVERWIPGANIRRDLFGIVDIIAIRGSETLAVQCTSASNVSSRVRKIAEAEHVATIREAGWRLEVWGWRKNSRGRWEHRTVDCS